MRYAIYYLPRSDSALWRYGCSVIGYDSSSGHDVDSCIPGFELQNLTGEPARYGFHATLKAPFRLAGALSEGELVTALSDFARTQAPVDLGYLEVRCIAGFIALAPRAPRPRLDELARLCVKTFDVFRAPLSEDERRRRLKTPLSASQQSYLDLWGYPYVFDEFRFHMTLTDSLPEDMLEPLRQQLAKLYASIDAAHRIEEISLCAQTQPGARFVQIARFRLEAGP